ncbi:MAG TPA: TIGR03118 family protein, partial [Vicinamibacteria bacterium]|nr:TIGR03118 family protein [Vicinamibacteria bacterium]
EHGSWLNAPWGVALAPGDFGAFTHNLLVGQFGSGEIAAYDVATGAFLGLMRDTSDHVLSIEGLWALSFGNGMNAGPLNTLFFTAGPDDEEHGLFGTLTAVTAEQLLGNGQ